MEATDLELGLQSQIEAHEDLIGRITALKFVDPAILAPVIKAATDCWIDGEDTTLVWLWLCRPSVRLDNLMPLEKAALGQSEEVLRIIGAIQYGGAV